MIKSNKSKMRELLHEKDVKVFLRHICDTFQRHNRSRKRGIVMMWLFVILIIGVFYYMYNGGQTSNFKKQSAASILDERFARGEIDEATYRNMKENLRR